MSDTNILEPCRSRSGLSCDRLREIEAEAQRAVGISLKRLAPFDMGAEAFSDIDFVASLLTGSNPESRQNLKLKGERVAGLLQPGSSGIEILYEAFHPIQRQRFSVAHELGHYYLHAHEGSGTYHRCPVRNMDSEEGEDAEEVGEEFVLEIEAEADAFAGAFLLPSAEFLAAVEKYGDASQFIAQLFCVSKGTVRNRMATLKLISVTLETGQ